MTKFAARQPVSQTREGYKVGPIISLANISPTWRYGTFISEPHVVEFHYKNTPFPSSLSGQVWHTPSNQRKPKSFQQPSLQRKHFSWNASKSSTSTSAACYVPHQVFKKKGEKMLSRNSTECVKVILICVSAHNAAVEVRDPNKSCAFVTSS